MRLLRLFSGAFALSCQRAVAFRADLVFQVTVSVSGSASMALALLVLFAHVRSLAGWRVGDAIALLGVFAIVSGLLDTFVEPNLDFFASRIANGELDDILLCPAPSILLASLSTCQPWSLAGVALGFLLTGVGALHATHPVSLGAALGFLLLLACGVAIAWSYRVMLASLSFWAPGVEATVLYAAVWQMGRFPVQVYGPAVRVLLTYVVPVAFVSTIPAQALTHRLDALLLVHSLTVSMGVVLVANLIWECGLRRYISATS